MPYERRIIEYRMVSLLQSIMMKPAGPMSDVAFKRVVPMDELSQKPLLPYFFNLQSERLFFTTTSSLAEVLAAPFIYEAQVAFLDRLYSVPLEQLESLGWPEVDNSNLMFILSIGRCGSTLISHMLNDDGRSSLSEFDIFGQLGMAKARDIPLLGSIVIDDVLRHSVAAIHALAPSGQGLAFKMQTQANPLIGAYLNTFPTRRSYFCYANRHPGLLP